MGGDEDKGTDEQNGQAEITLSILHWLTTSCLDRKKVLMNGKIGLVNPQGKDALDSDHQKHFIPQVRSVVVWGG